MISPAKKQWKFRVSDKISIAVIIGLIMNIAFSGWILRGYHEIINTNKNRIEVLETCNEKLKDTQNKVYIIEKWIDKNEDLPLNMVKLRAEISNLNTQIPQLTDQIRQINIILMSVMREESKGK